MAFPGHPVTTTTNELDGLGKPILPNPLPPAIGLWGAER
jgi:hypothetical protein